MKSQFIAQTLTALTLLTISCGPSQNQSSVEIYEEIYDIINSNRSIFGGNEVLKIQDHFSAKHTVAIKAKNIGICSASIIAANAIITAVHCVSHAYYDPEHPETPTLEAIDPKNLQIYFEPTLNKETFSHVAAQIVLHPQFKLDSETEFDLFVQIDELNLNLALALAQQNFEDKIESITTIKEQIQKIKQLILIEGKNKNDLAIVFFEDPLPENYRPASLLNLTENDLKVNDFVVLAGYGSKNPEQSQGTGQLRYAEVAVLDPNFSATQITVRQDEGRGACLGDSGGPAYLVRNNKVYLVGATQGGADCANAAIYTFLPSYAEWIDQELHKASLLKKD